MKQHFLLFVYLLFASTVSAQRAQDSLCGKYVCAPLNLYVDSFVIILKPHKRFIQSAKRGYLYEKKWYTGKGKWKQEGDSIVLYKYHFIAKSGGRFGLLPRRFENTFFISGQHVLIYDDKIEPRLEYSKVPE